MDGLIDKLKDCLIEGLIKLQIHRYRNRQIDVQIENRYIDRQMDKWLGVK